MTTLNRAAALHSWIFLRDPALQGSFAIRPPGGCWASLGRTFLVIDRDVRRAVLLRVSADFNGGYGQQRALNSTMRLLSTGIRLRDVL